MPQNIFTGAQRSKVHHCKACKGSIKASCYTKRHVAVCMELLEDGRPCGETFTVISKGCFKHPYLLGYNKGVKSGDVSDNKHMKCWNVTTAIETCETESVSSDDSSLTSPEKTSPEFSPARRYTK